MKKLLLTTAAICLSASLCLASNSGFKLNFDINYSPGLSNINFVSFPYFYFPDNDTTNTGPTAQDVCIDLNDGTGDTPIANIRRFNPSSDTFSNKACGNPVAGFPIEKGTGYALIPNSNITNPTTLVIVGSHDDQYASNKTPGSFTPIQITHFPGMSNLHFLSVPYHWQPDPNQDGGPSNDMKGLCWTVNGNAPGGPLVSRIRRFNPSSDTFSDKACATPVQGWQFTPGASYAFQPNPVAPQPVDVSFTVY